MSHDAATGYLTSNPGTSSVVNLYAKNQIGTVYDQLNDGARALDVRPKLLANSTLVLQHGFVEIPISLESLVRDAIRWSMENADELILIMHHNLVYESDITPSADTAVTALSNVYQSLGVTYAGCDDVYGLTVAETMELAQLSQSTSGGYLLALDRHDAYASSCAKLNYVPSQIVTCYPAKNSTSNNSTVPCTKRNSPTVQALKEYVLASTNNYPTDSQYELGPPASQDYYPFNAIQALWQVDTHSAALGVAHVSSLIDDNTKSQLNAHVVDWVYSGQFSSVSLLMVDHVQLNGNALLSVLRNTCGQSELDTNNKDENRFVACGKNLPKPKLYQKHMSTLSFFATSFLYLLFALWIAYMIRHYRKYYNHDQEIRRIQDNITAAEKQVHQVFTGQFT